MSEYTLMLIEATGIQDYIFGSNQLAQNIGASELVTQATTDWVVETLNTDGLSHNAEWNAEKGEWEPTDRGLKSHGLQSEVVYMGGGNAMLLFTDDGQAKKFARCLTRRTVEYAPGLSLVLIRQKYDAGSVVLAELHQDLREKLGKRKLSRERSVPLLGLGVTAACVYTGLPAVEMKEEQLISAEVQAKLNATSKGKDRLKRSLPQVEEIGFEFVYDFDDFGEKGESSYLAVIHADGNNMGERIKAIGKKHKSPDENENYVLVLRRFSKSVQKAAETALKTTVDILLANWDQETQLFGGKVPTPVRDKQEYIPFRPIVFGGDDVTFVCEGRLGLALAATYLKTYSNQSLDDKKLAYSRAGVAVVKSHYPFSRAYGLADELIKSAKEYIREWDDEGKLTVMDWHFAVSGLVLPLKQVRKREYLAHEGNLLMRPLRLNDPDGDWRSWQTFTEVLMAEFQKEEKDGGQWAGRRNKIKAFRDALRSDRDAVQQFLHLYDLNLPDIPGAPEMKNKGWQGGRCGYFDPIEALDFYVPLKGGQA
ncbi:MAG: hypothetical protein KJ638_01100 [Chloroflexi bacterium]|nr:hypothetical protein [Chloroflexota bacterium]